MEDSYGLVIFAYNLIALRRGLSSLHGEDTDVALTVKKAYGSKDDWTAEITIRFHKYKRYWCMHADGTTGQGALTLLRLRAHQYFVERTNDSPDEWYDHAWT